MEIGWLFENLHWKVFSVSNDEQDSEKVGKSQTTTKEITLRTTKFPFVPPQLFVGNKMKKRKAFFPMHLGEFLCLGQVQRGERNRERRKLDSTSIGSSFYPARK